MLEIGALFSVLLVDRWNPLSEFFDQLGVNSIQFGVFDHFKISLYSVNNASYSYIFENIKYVGKIYFWKSAEWNE